MAPADDPSVDVVAAYYDEWNSKWRDGDFDDIDPEIRQRGQRVLEVMHEQGALFPRILEVGCGTGWLSAPLAAMGEVTAIDLSPRAIEIARQHEVPARLIADDFLAHDFGPETFDAIVVVETLFYLLDQAAAMEKLARLCAPGGLLLLTCINQWVYERRSEIGPPEPGQPRHCLPLGELRAMMASRFEALDVETIDPRGDQGVLRVVNSWKLNRIADRVFSPGAVRRWKERRGWGAGVVISARRKSAVASATA